MFFDAFDVRRRSQQVFFLWTGDTKRTPNGKCQMLRRKQAKTMNKLCCPREREFIQCAGYKLSGKGLPFFLGVSLCFGSFLQGGKWKPRGLPFYYSAERRRVMEKTLEISRAGTAANHV